MSDYRVIRGSEVIWHLRFFDENKNPVSPPSAKLYVSYEQNGVKAFNEIPMVGQSEGLFVAEWDSSVADAGFVYWHARCTGDTPVGVDGRLVLLANDANPGPL